ncbi:peptidase M20 [Bacteroidia bacterium]|nr:peptidase M20 [Bacteroidia bacterium]
MKKAVNIIILCLFFTPAFAQKIDKNVVLKKVENVDAYVRKVRVHLHENPELSGKEVNTSAYLQAEITKLGLPITKVPASTGFYAVLDTKKAGKTIGLRTDIDALPIHESTVNLKQQKQHLSKNAGVSQACGHDGHMAILLGAAKILTELKDQLRGKIVFIFEEGEETGSGIDPMLEVLKSIHFDAIYGNHLKSNLQVGKLFIREGAIMAGTGTVAFDVVGRGGHASRPDLSINPVFAAANILTGISIAWNNQLDITKTVTLGITQIQGSEVYNVIPNKAFVGGTIRFFDKEEAEKSFDVIRKVSENIAAAHNCTVRFHSQHGIYLYPVVNDAKLTQFTREVVGQLYPDRVVTDEEYIWYAAESFTKYSQLAPTVFVFPGIKNEALGSGAEHHNDQFDIDENALQYATGAMVQFAVKYLD